MRRFRHLVAPVVAIAAAAVPLITAGSARAGVTQFDVSVPSFDGTRIAATVFLPDGASEANPVPVIFQTHGWGGTRTTTASGVADLLAAGYAVLTWDSRGFGDSGGDAAVDSQEFEVKDAQALIDFAASLRTIRRDAPGDPRMGMVGGSYAGGIQLMLAAVDARVDAIVPQIAWNDLVQSLRPNGVLKLGWDLVLYGAGAATATGDGLDATPRQTGAYDQHIHQAFVEGTALNDWSTDTVDWFAARSPARYVAGLRAPTLLLQGESDTLFNLNEGIHNYTAIAGNGVPTKLVAFCGGHAANVSCTTGNDLATPTANWLRRYVKGDTTADTGAAIDWFDQTGVKHSLSALPTATVSASGTVTVANTIAPTSGAVIPATAAPEALRIPVPDADGRALFGAPQATLSVTGVGPEAFLFVKLVDLDANGIPTVVDDQATALKVVNLSLDTPQVITLDVAGIGWVMKPGHHLAIEITTTSATHASARTPFVASVAATVDVPVV